MTLESRPQDKTIETDFGLYESKTVISNDTITYSRRIEMNKFRVKSKRFNEYRDFLLKIKKADNSRVVFKM